MNPKLRLRILAGVFFALILANLYFRLGDNSFERAMFWTDTNAIDAQYPATLQRTLDVINASPKLSFRNQNPLSEEPEIGRNPFIFGIDRRAEAAQRERLAELQKAREEAREEAQAQAEPVVEIVEADPGFDGEILGIFENLENGVRKAAISTELGLQIVSAGDVIAKRYRVLDVNYARLRLHDMRKDRDIEVLVETK